MFWQKIKQGFLLLVVSVGFLLSLSLAFGFAQPAYAAGEAAQPPAPQNLSQVGITDQNKGFFADPLASVSNALSTGFATLVNLLLLTAIKIVQKFMELMAYLFSFVIEALKAVISYRGYAEQKEVSSAWAITRDLVNSFFIVVLIAIAISTIIRFQQYNFRSTLPRLILAALLVNFSKTICLLAISFANSVMSTFATALAEILPVYAIGLRLPALTAFDSSSLNGLYDDYSNAARAIVDKPPVEMLTILVSSIVGAAMLIFALGGVVMFLIILLFRIIVLWFLIILSPLAFFLWGVPGRASSYWGQWLEEFVKHLIIGPIGAFFLYIIAYFYVQNIKTSYGLHITANLAVPTLTQGVTPNVLIGYLISLGMMFISLEIIEQFGVRGGQFARNIGIEKISKGTISALRSGAGVAADFATKWTGIPLSPTRALEGIKGGLATKREQLAKDAVRKTAKTAEAMAERGSFLLPAYAYATGNEDLIASMGVKDIYQFAKGALPGKATDRGADLDRLKVEYNSTKNHTTAVQQFSAMSAPIKDFVGSKTKAQLAQAMATEIAAHKSYKEAQAQIPQLMARANAGDVAAQAALPAFVSSVNDYEAAHTAEAIAQMDDVVKNEKAISDFQDSLSKDGVQLGATDNLSTMDSRTDGNQAIAARKATVMGELKRRQKFASLAVAGARSDLTSKVQDYMKETYIRDQKYDAEDIYSNSLMNRDPQKRAAFAGDLIKAAENGKFDDLLLKYQDKSGNSYDASVEGVKRFIDEVLIDELKFSDQEAYTILAEVQGRNGSSNKISQTNYVSLDGITKDFKLASSSEHSKSVEKGVKNKGAYETLRTAKRDGLGFKDASGKWTMNAGAIAGLKGAGLRALIDNSQLMTQIDANTKEMLLDNATELGLDAGVQDQIRASIK